ncbi:hypothetical protein PIB30_028347 [Stylosanthes scabra]|uniref:Uncharacterized protein n=1 Tax=Stylosanthes scabra TaxID=79078 RepID=A0ABU6QB59_9FABA|nr:hypothetical protein [Stylosanthes scabra]
MEGNQTDIISSLPESLLLYTLSTLPFKEAAKTCILSKKWLQMWHSTNPVVNNKLEFTNDDKDHEAIEAQQRKAFKNFIKNWIIFHKHHHLNEKFTLKISPPSNCSHIIGACIDFVSEDGVKDLELDFAKPQWENEEEDPEQDNDSALVVFPRCIYEHEKLHQKLESLKLHSCNFSPESFAKFEALRDVTLAWMPLRTETVKTLLSSCKWIESLTLKRCWDLEDLELGKLELKKLVIDNCSLDVDDICFEARNLKAFKYSGLVGVSDVIVEASTIEEADFDFDTMFFECGNLLQKFLYDFSAVNVLTVCSVLLQTIHLGDEPVRLQGNMMVRHLKMKIQLHQQELHGFLWILNSCPRLTKLTIDLDRRCSIVPGYEDPYYNVDHERFWDKLIVPFCLRKNLREVEVNGFMGTRNQVMACYFFIGAALKLKKLTIKVLNEENDDHAMVHMRHLSASQLLLARRASNDLIATREYDGETLEDENPITSTRIRFWDRVIVPFCLRKNLREVEVNGFMGTRNQVMACYYFISGALKLKKLTIKVLNEENDDPVTCLIFPNRNCFLLKELEII